MFHLIFIQLLQLKKLSPCNTPLSVVTSFRLSIRFCPKFEIPDVLNPRDSYGEFCATIPNADTILDRCSDK